ncbi:unnamed protein product [Paramecium pentaurelia]|uniref:EML-like second beta-propeller domain-containing protein n=1 Tax=Paramecium pentaurelia TaxID=43138 RepID=A0A8S1W3I8_9CILI|nr:unnamed protein product [Paramecium pentaurelia]
MNCTYHIRNPISLICKAPHKCKCQRKLCVECQYIHGVDFRHTIPLTIFQEMAMKKLKDSKLYETSELTKQTMAFKSLLSQTESMLKKIWEELSQSIKQIYDMIEKENQSFFNLINENTNLAECSYTDLEKIIKIVDGTTLNDWNAQKNSFITELDKTKNWWEYHLKAFVQKSKEGIQQIMSLIKIQSNQEEESEVYQMKEDLSEMFTYIQDVDESIYQKILQILRREKVSDILAFLSKNNNHQFYESFINNLENTSDLQKKIKKIINVLRNIQDHQFNQVDYSSDNYEKPREDLSKMIVEYKGIIDFIKFLVLLTSIDVKFIQCGSNGLNLLVGMKIDIRNQSFENIRIKNTSLIGGNFFGCNFNGSEFDNVDISGVNLNGTILFNCKWKNLKIHELKKLDGHSSCVRSVCISPDGNTLASGSDDKSIRIWDIKTGQQKAKLDGHILNVNSVCFSPDGNTLASGSGSPFGGSDCFIGIWDVKRGQQIAKLDGHILSVNQICFSPDGSIIASGSSDKSIRLWDIKTGQQKAKLDGHTSYVMSVCFSPNGNTLASGSSDKSIRLWDIKTGQQKAKLDCHSDYVRAVCFSPDGNTLASGSYDKSICLWDIKKGLQKAKLDGHSGTVYSVCFSPDGNTLTSASYDNSICLWDLKTGKQKVKLDGHNEPIRSICFSPNGNTLASGSSDNSIRLWDVKTGQQKAKLDGHTSSVISLCFSPDGNILASSSSDNSIHLWDVKTGQQKAKLDGYNNALQSICFSVDGNTLATCSEDGSIHLWDINTRKQIQIMDKTYKNIFAQFKTPLFQNYLLPVMANKPILIISQQALFQAQGALILKGEFINQSGLDLKTVFKQKGSCFSETLFQK